jgi:hypothetical protein
VREVEAQPRFRSGAEPHGAELTRVRVDPFALDLQLGRHGLRVDEAARVAHELGATTGDGFDVVGIERHRSPGTSWSIVAARSSSRAI